MPETPRTLIVAPDAHLHAHLIEHLMPHLTGANVTIYERPNDAPYGDNGEQHEKVFGAAVRAASHTIVAVAGAESSDIAAVRQMFGWTKPLGLMVKSCNPAAYEKFGKLHQAHPRFKVVVAVGGPNNVQNFFSRPDGLSIPVFTPFDLEHKQGLLMMQVFDKLWN